MAELTELDLGDGTSREISDAKSRANFAPEFSASTSYAVDDIVTHEGVLYKCTTAHSAGAWNNAHFTQTTCADAFNGGGSSVKKTRYTISSSSWSASANASGYYTYSVTLNPTLVTTQPPDVSCAGSTDSTVPTATEKSNYDLVDYYNNTATDTLVLYAKTKPTGTFYIWVEGEIV